MTQTADIQLATGFAEDVWHICADQSVALCGEPVYLPSNPPKDYRLCTDCQKASETGDDNAVV